MFTRVQNNLGISDRTPKNRKRNMSELSWKSAVSEMRAIKKRDNHNNDDHGDDDDDRDEMMDFDESERNNKIANMVYVIDFFDRSIDDWQ